MSTSGYMLTRTRTYVSGGFILSFVVDNARIGSAAAWFNLQSSPVSVAPCARALRRAALREWFFVVLVHLVRGMVIGLPGGSR